MKSPRVWAVATLLGVGLLATSALAASGNLPLSVPAGWDGQRQSAGFVMKPKDLAAGQFYTVVVIDLVKKVGSVRGLLEAGEASLGEVGRFQPANAPASGRNDQGWEFEVVIGPLEKDGKSVLAEAMGLRRGEEEGVIIVIADSVETMTKYSDPFTAMIKGLGPAASGGGKVDLRFRAPAGWTQKDIEGNVLLEKTVNTFYDKYSFRVLILPSEPLTDGLRATFLANWAAKVTPTLETHIAPLPLVRRLKSGAAVGYDTDVAAKTKNGGASVNGGLYIVASGKRYVPILVFYFGGTWGGQLDTDLEGLLESAEIPGSGGERVPLFAAGDLVGEWSTSSASYASYVTASGSYAGDASISTASTLTLRSDGSFKRFFRGITSSRVVNDGDAGTWKVDDMRVVETGKEASAYWVLGVGSDPKAGAFLVLGGYSNTEAKASLANPRGFQQGEWYKRKD